VTGKRIPAILADLRALGSEKNRAGMARYGIKVDDAFGVSIPELRKVAKRLGSDHDRQPRGAPSRLFRRRPSLGDGQADGRVG
jgi:3-methyladenine DNA glycosylase AlkD